MKVIVSVLFATLISCGDSEKKDDKGQAADAVIDPQLASQVIKKPKKDAVEETEETNIESTDDDLPDVPPLEQSEDGDGMGKDGDMMTATSTDSSMSTDSSASKSTSSDTSSVTSTVVATSTSTVANTSTMTGTGTSTGSAPGTLVDPELAKLACDSGLTARQLIRIASRNTPPPGVTPAQFAKMKTALQNVTEAQLQAFLDTCPP